MQLPPVVFTIIWFTYIIVRYAAILKVTMAGYNVYLDPLMTSEVWQ